MCCASSTNSSWLPGQWLALQAVSCKCILRELACLPASHRDAQTAGLSPDAVQSKLSPPLRAGDEDGASAEDDMQLAWEMLEVARTLYSKAAPVDASALAGAALLCCLLQPAVTGVSALHSTPG